MAEHQVLFCPFCRESFEAVARCPEHDLKLVAFDRLGPDPLDEGPDPELVDSAHIDELDPGFGRGFVAAGAVINACSLGFEFVRGVKGSAGLTVRELAITAPSLWTLPLVSFTLLFLLRRRRTPRALRGLRVLVPLLALVSPATFAWALWRLHQGVAVWATGKRTIGLEIGSAFWIVGLATVLILFGGIRLGVHGKRQSSRRHLSPHA